MRNSKVMTSTYFDLKVIGRATTCKRVLPICCLALAIVFLAHPLAASAQSGPAPRSSIPIQWAGATLGSAGGALAGGALAYAATSESCRSEDLSCLAGATLIGGAVGSIVGSVAGAELSASTFDLNRSLKGQIIGAVVGVAAGALGGYALAQTSSNHEGVSFLIGYSVSQGLVTAAASHLLSR